MTYKDPARKRQYQREWERRTKRYNPTYKRAYDLLSQYGLTETDYEKMAAKQEYCCRLCLRPAQLERFGKLSVDHLKGTKAVRGLLCAKCNKGLGLFDENPTVLAAAIEYLRCQPL
jgi:hypothetical protein